MTYAAARLRRVSVVGSACLALALTGCGDNSNDNRTAATGVSGSDAGEVRQVKFMTFPGQAYRLPIVVADKEGLFAERKISVSHADQPPQLSGIQGLEATKSQVSLQSVGTTGQALQSGGAKAQFFCGGISVIQSTLVAPLDSDLPDSASGADWTQILKALSGKKVGIPVPKGSGLYLMFEEAFREAGVEDVVWVNIGGATTNAIAAMENGSVDAALVTPTGKQYLEVNKKAKEILYLPGGPPIYESYGSAWTSPEAWLEDNPELADDVCSALTQATKWIQDPANKDKASSYLQEDAGIDKPVADLALEEAYKEYSTDLPKDVLGKTFENFTKLGVFKADPPVTYESMVVDHTKK